MNKNHLHEVQTFFSWWGGELVSLMPSTCQQFFSVAKNQLFFRLSPEGLSVTWLNDKQTTELGVFPLDQQGCAAFQEALTNKGSIEQAERIFVLSPCQFISRQVTLPTQAKSNLPQVLSFEMDRFTPFSSDQVFYDAVCGNTTNQADSMMVELAVVPKRNLKDMLDELLVFDIKPSKVCFSTQPDSNEYRDEFNLLPTRLRPTVNKKNLYISAGLVLLFCLQLSFISLYPNWRAKEHIVQLHQQVEELKVDAQAVGKIRAEIRQQREQITVLLEKPSYKRRVIDVVKEMSERLPENTWLNQMRISANKIQIKGFSSDATSVIQHIDNSLLFENTRFTSPLASSKGSQQPFKISTVIVESE
jgi:general secretion pathway protein L